MKPKAVPPSAADNEALPFAEILLGGARVESGAIHGVVSDAVHLIRVHLGMEVAFVSEFTGGKRMFRYVDALGVAPIAVGGGDPLEESYCQRVVDGRLPELIPDALQNAAALELPATRALPVRAHLSVPVRLSDGRIYGTFCCFTSAAADPSLGKRDLALMRAFGDFIGKQIERELQAEAGCKAAIERINATLRSRAFHSVYQPILDLARQRIVGFESLTRFDATPPRTPDLWFKEANEVGLGEALEMAAIEKALVALDHLPRGVYLSLNTSPEHILSGAVARVLEAVPLERIVLEVTEHCAVPDYSCFAAILEPLRRRGLRVAVDDAGAGYASFRHILQLEPDLIKLDIELIRNIDGDAKRRALAVALITFARETGSGVIAEGVETAAELNTLRSLQVGHAQGYLLGRPGTLETVLARLQD